MNIFKLVNTFTKEFKKHIQNGAKVISPSQYKKRLETCNDCPHFLYISKRCGKCGCFMTIKAKWEIAKCPDNPSRWEEVGDGKK